WHISAKTKYADLGAEWLNYVITSTQAKQLMFGQQQLPADKSAKAPAGDPYLTAVYTAFKTVADDNGLLLYTDWASPSMYTTLQKTPATSRGCTCSPAWPSTGSSRSPRSSTRSTTPCSPGTV